MSVWKYASIGRADDSTLMVLEARDENNVEVFRGQFLTMDDAAKALTALDQTPPHQLLQEAIGDALQDYGALAGWDISGEFSSGRIWLHDHASGRLLATLTVEQPDDPEGINL